MVKMATNNYLILCLDKGVVKTKVGQKNLILFFLY